MPQLWNAQAAHQAQEVVALTFAFIGGSGSLGMYQKLPPKPDVVPPCDYKELRRRLATLVDTYTAAQETGAENQQRRLSRLSSIAYRLKMSLPRTGAAEQHVQVGLTLDELIGQVRKATRDNCGGYSCHSMREGVRGIGSRVGVYFYLKDDVIKRTKEGKAYSSHKY